MRRYSISLALMAIGIIAITMIPNGIVAVTPNYTQVANTTFCIDDDGIYTTGDRSPLYHDLYVAQGGDRLVTFSNTNSFTDLRTDGKLRKLVITVTAGGNEVKCAEEIYTPPFNHECEGFVSVFVEYNGDDLHYYHVTSHYRIYDGITGEWEGTYVSMEEVAIVREIINPEK